MVGPVQLILARHGNTFGSGDKVVWAGAAQDLALVDRGIEQGRALGAWLARSGLALDAIYCGPLQRTRGTAALAVEVLETAAQKNESRVARQPVPIRVEPALDEIDYGSWGGRTTAEVVAEFGADTVDAWNSRGVMPAKAGFAPTVVQLKAEARRFVDELRQRHGADDRVLLVSSNGRLRWFLGLVPNALEDAFHAGTAKMKTGHVSQLAAVQGSDAWRLEFWNRDPATL